MGRDKRRRNFDDDKDELRLKALAESYRRIRKKIPPPSRFIEPGVRRKKCKSRTQDYLEEVYGSTDDSTEKIDS